jgi:hypothetical protein
MTIANAKVILSQNPTRFSWGPDLDSSSATPLTTRGAIRWDFNPHFGYRRFQYLRCDQAGGCTAGQLQSYRANATITNISGSHTTTTITTSGLTASEYVGGILFCHDDAGGAGAGPEGESGMITANSTTVITIDDDDAFSAAPANNDDFTVVLPWAVDDSADGDEVGNVAGVAMAAHDQYDWGWFQCEGIHPTCDIIAAGTALPVGESLVADAALLTDGAGDGIDLRVGKLKVPIASDQVVRTAVVDLFCGAALRISNSTA